MSYFYDVFGALYADIFDSLSASEIPNTVRTAVSRPSRRSTMPKHNVFRDGHVHVLSEECATCIFRPHERPVSGARVAGMVRDTKDEPGATVVCHHTLYRDVDAHAICRGWWDRLAHHDPILQLAQALGIVREQTPKGAS